MTCRLIIQRLVQEIVPMVIHRCLIINRILHVLLWIRILIFSCSSRYREGVRYRLEYSLEDQIRIHLRACNILSDYLQFSKIRRVFLCMYKLVC